MNGNSIDTQTMSNTSNDSDELKRSKIEGGNAAAKGCYLHPVNYVSLTEKIRKRIANNDRWFSLEFFPARTPNGAVNLIGW